MEAKRLCQLSIHPAFLPVAFFARQGLKYFLLFSLRHSTPHSPQSSVGVYFYTS